MALNTSYKSYSCTVKNSLQQEHSLNMGLRGGVLRQAMLRSCTISGFSFALLFTYHKAGNLPKGCVESPLGIHPCA